MNIIGIDFSINKPAATIQTDINRHIHFIWPFEMKLALRELYNKYNVNVIDRNDIKEKNISNTIQMQYQVQNSIYIASLITESLKPYLNNNTFISFEGFSYASGGNVAIQLGAYKYILMDRLSKYVPFENMYTYSPQTLKSIAGCASKGSKKSDVIDAFRLTCHSDFAIALKDDTFKTKKAKNWEVCVDDIADSFWALKSFLAKDFKIS